MKKWEELTDDQRLNFRRFLTYITSDDFYRDMIKDCRDMVISDLKTHGYNPDEMSTEEMIVALKAIDALEGGEI